MRPPVKIALLLFSLLVLFGAGPTLDPGPSIVADRPAWSLWQTPSALRQIGRSLSEWREKLGRWPTNAEGLAVLGPGSEEAEALVPELTRSGRLDPDQPNPWPLGFPGGRLSSLLVPIVYENRNETRPDAFRPFDSGRGDWWIEPAPGIVLWAPEGTVVEAEHQAARSAAFGRTARRIAFTLLVLAAFVTVVVLTTSLLRVRRRPGVFSPGALAAKIGLALLGAQVLWVACSPTIARVGVSHVHSRFRDLGLPVDLRPAAVREWERSLDERVAAGVIPASEREARLDAFATAEAALLSPGQRVAAPRPPR